ncbi:GNAT family N-acetyltransferase [Streptomyces sp. NPDC040750]|uniref:GNAT family N-acetyltransferase n=1 Tax=unclassified Streptomyces TaxID=2593676 RepID=UPI0033F5AA7D
MRTHKTTEHEIDAESRAAIEALLGECFPGYPARDHFKQLPHFRYLVRDGDTLVAHAGVEHRMIRNAGVPLRIFGIVDLCVAARARSRGCASRLLAEIEATARAAGVDAILLFADDPRLYLANGYQRVPGDARWLMIHEHESLGVAEKHVAETMVKTLSAEPWREGTLDLLGHLY